jgi:hypothetical protein
MGLGDNPSCRNAVLMRKYQSTFYVNVRPWPLLAIHTWGPSFVDPEDIRELDIGAIWSFGKGTGLL